MSDAKSTEWQCDCGAWVPIGFSRHTHVGEHAVSFDDLHAIRRAQEAGLSSVVNDALEIAEITHVWRNAKHPTR